MKKYILITLLLLGFINAKSQGNYFNYWDSTTVIKSYRTNYVGRSCQNAEYRTDYFDGDTMINSKYYYRKFSLFLDSFPGVSCNTDYHAYTNINKKGPFYVRETPDLYFLQYNLTTNTDDTILDNNIIRNSTIGESPSQFFVGCTIHYIDSLYLYGKPLKRIGSFQFTLTPTQSQFTLEGLGLIAVQACSYVSFYGSTNQFVSIIKKQKDSLFFGFPNMGNLFLEPVRTSHFTNYPLPVNLVSFTCQFNERAVILNWLTTNEINFSHFEIERSNDGINFNKVGTVNTKFNSYTFTDNSPIENQNYYRLKMVNNDGSFNYSHIIEAKAALQYKLITLAPNPVRDYANITIQSQAMGTATILLTDLVGRVVRKEKLELTSGKNQLSINCASLQSGFYQLSVITNNEKESIKVIKE